MAKISKKKLPQKFKTESLRLFLGNIKKIKSINAAERFLDTFSTPAEKEIVLRRLTAMNLLNKGGQYRKIQDTLEISRNTISKIKHILLGDGYGRNLGKRAYSSFTLCKEKQKQKKLFRPYKGAESII